MTDTTNHEPIRVFSARACAAPLRKAGELFQRRTGTPVRVSVCARHCATRDAEEATAETGLHDFLVEIAEDACYDLAIGGAEYLLDDGEVRGIVRKGERRLIAYRKSALIVPRGNPAGIGSLDDLTREGVRVGISVIDCLKGLWEDVTGRAGLTDPVRRNITFRASGCVAIVEAAAEGLVDAAFGWTAFEHLGDGRIEVVKLSDEHCVYRGTGIAMLSFAERPDRCRRFMDFLTTDEARRFYLDFGWVFPGRG